MTSDLGFDVRSSAVCVTCMINCVCVAIQSLESVLPSFCAASHCAAMKGSSSAKEEVAEQSDNGCAMVDAKFYDNQSFTQEEFDAETERLAELGQEIQTEMNAVKQEIDRQEIEDEMQEVKKEIARITKEELADGHEEPSGIHDMKKVKQEPVHCAFDVVPPPPPIWPPAVLPAIPKVPIAMPLAPPTPPAPPTCRVPLAPPTPPSAPGRSIGKPMSPRMPPPMDMVPHLTRSASSASSSSAHEFEQPRHNVRFDDAPWNSKRRRSE